MATKLGPTSNPGNAWWCTDHTRLECVKNRTKGRGKCHGPAIKGTDSCTRHSGRKLSVLKARGAAVITAWSAEGEPQDGKRVDPGVAALGMLQQAWIRAAAYGELLRRQVALDEPTLDPNGFNPDGAVQADGLIGFRYGAAGKDGHIYAVSEEARALVKLEAEERDRVVRYAKTAHDMGISDRVIGLAEKWGDLVVGRIMIVIGELDLTPEQQAKVPELIQAHLGQIEIGA